MPLTPSATQERSRSPFRTAATGIPARHASPLPSAIPDTAFQPNIGKRYGSHSSPLNPRPEPALASGLSRRRCAKTAAPFGFVLPQKQSIMARSSVSRCLLPSTNQAPRIQPFKIRPSAAVHKEEDMSNIFLEQRLWIACAIAREAGSLQKRRFLDRDKVAFQFKGPQDYLTATDGEVEKLVRERLLASFPEDTVLGEEDGGQVSECT